MMCGKKMKLAAIALLTILLICSIAQAQDVDAADLAYDVTTQCALKVTSGKADALTDGDLTSAWTPSKENAELRITLPEIGAGYLHVEWKILPTNYEIVQYDATQRQISTQKYDGGYLGITDVFRIEPNARYVALKLIDAGQKVSEVKVYSNGELPESVHDWFEPLTKCDMLVLAAHQGDEFACFGGLLPYYSKVDKRRVQVVYMTYGGRAECAQTLDALWSVGIENYPEFLGLKSSEPDSLSDAVADWGGKDKLVETMTELIRKYQPEVVVTHDAEGENGDFQHIVTAQALKLAVEAAADATKHPKSAENYGAWQVKKLYMHLGSEKLISLDWNEACEQLDGKSPLDVAKAAYGLYDTNGEKGCNGENGDYSLVLSSVGDDLNGTGFFENIDAASEDDAVEPSVSLVPTPSATPAIIFSPEPTSDEPVQSGSVDGFGSAAVRVMLFVGGGIGIMLLVTLLQALIYSLRRR